ncbi:MAG: 6-bladed beta-propeller [Tannerella sp.]|nr:6-bladed beta-propeller [Tannerella sp.]
MGKILYIILALIMVVACNQRNSRMQESVTVKIDLGATPNRESATDFQKHFSIDKLIPLETSDSSLLGVISQVIVSGENIFILDMLQNSIFRFNIDGNFTGKISHQGQGPHEYIKARSIAVVNDELYVSDLTRILQYNLDGKHLKTFSMEDQKTYQLIVNKSGDMIVAGSYIDEYMLNVYDSSWNKTASYFPRDEQLADMTLTRTTYNSLGFYNDGIFITNYFDPTVYYIKNNEVKPLVKFDFGINNIPNDFFACPPEEKLDKFTAYRGKSVMGISGVTVSDDWIIFYLEEGPASGSSIMFYDRKQNEYVSSQWLDIPCSMFFEKWNNAPHGYTETGKYYSAISSKKLREMIEEVAKKEKDYLFRYEFLKEIDPAKINEEDNDWLVFFTLK